MKFLVCTDGSERSQKVLSLAAAIAVATRAEATILGITEQESGEGKLREILKRAQGAFQEQGTKTDLVITHGDAVDEIVERTPETSFDLIVIGSERKRSEGSFLLSAKAYSLISAISTPVLVVPETRFQLKRFLICTGGGTYIDNAVQFTGLLAGSLAASVTLMNVVPEPPAMHAKLTRLEEDVNALLNSNSTLGRNLKAAKGTLERFGLAAEVRIRHGIVIHEVLKEVEDGDYDVVVCGSWPLRDPWRHYVIGNVTREIVSRADRPVLVVRSDKKPASFLDRARGLIARLGAHSRVPGAKPDVGPKAE
jgi:nucleotide-binding universal stress UspA family protein